MVCCFKVLFVFICFVLTMPFIYVPQISTNVSLLMAPARMGNVSIMMEAIHAAPMDIQAIIAKSVCYITAITRLCNSLRLLTVVKMVFSR